MLSTLLNYRIQTTSMTKTLERVEQSGSVAADAKYYAENIGKVETVDAFLDDYRLYTYALKAYGLEEQIGSKGFIRKVIESDLSDKTSFANVLADERYRDLANAFDFKTVSEELKPQSGRQLDAMIDAYSEHRVRLGASVGAKTSYFEAEMAKVKTVDDFIGNTALFDFAMKSIGVEANLMSRSYVRDILTGVTADNKASFSDDKFFVLADKLGFGSDGTLLAGAPALDATELEAMVYQYNSRTGNLSSPGAAARETTYFTQQVKAAPNVDVLLADPRIVAYLQTSFVLPNDVSKAVLRNVLTSDVADPNSYVNRTVFQKQNAYPDYDKRLREMAQIFAFAPTGGAAAGGALDPAGLEAVTDRYLDNYMFEAKKADDNKILAFETVLSGRIKSVSELLAHTPDYDTDAMEFALKAFDIDPETVSLTMVRRALQSDVSDPNSYVNRLKDERFVNLAAAFNFDETGKVRPERVVQSAAKMTETGSLYRTSFGEDLSTARKDVITAETKRYIVETSAITSFDDFIENDFVIRYALQAYGLGDEKLSADVIEKIFKSDLQDPDSYVNSLGDRRYVKLVEAFNFDPAGRVRIDQPGIQSGSALYSTQNLYLMTTLEQQVGETSEGARLALYFLRKAPETTTTLQLLADKPLTQVVLTALGLPDTISQLDLDKQVALIEKTLDVKDFQDPKKLDIFIARFAALYDVTNADLTQSSPALALFGQSDNAAGGILAIL